MLTAAATTSSSQWRVDVQDPGHFGVQQVSVLVRVGLKRSKQVGSQNVLTEGLPVHSSKNSDEFIINEKSVSLAREVTRTLAVVSSCCTNSVKSVKVTPRVPGYGCWLDDVTRIVSPCCIDGDVPASGLGLSEDYYAFALNLTSIQKFPQSSHRTHGNSAQFPYPSHDPIPIPIPVGIPISTAALTIST